MIELTDFVEHADVPQDTIDRYRGRVPDDLIDLWQRYGYGSFGRGFFRIIDPDAYLAGIGDGIGRVADDEAHDVTSIPIYATGLADLICWEPNPDSVTALLFRDHRLTGLGRRIRTMFTIMGFDGIETYGSRDLDWEMYGRAVDAFGALGHHESFAYATPPSPGGARTLEDVRKVETIAAIRGYVELQGVIEH